MLALLFVMKMSKYQRHAGHNDWWIVGIVFASSKPEFGTSHDLSTYHVTDCKHSGPESCEYNVWTQQMHDDV
jgi:hypothetical protein